MTDCLSYYFTELIILLPIFRLKYGQCWINKLWGFIDIACIFENKVTIMVKKLSVLLLTCLSISAYAQQRDYPIQPVPFTSVKLSDQFWSSRIETNRTVTIPASFERCENTG